MNAKLVTRVAAGLAAALAVAAMAALLHIGRGAANDAGRGVFAPVAAAASPNATAASFAGVAGKSTPAPKPDLPDDRRFVPAGESGDLRLWADPATGHFKVERKSTGAFWYSYPDPAEWKNETINGTWRDHLLSPVLLEAVDISNSKSQSKTINWYDDGGTLDDFRIGPDGFSVTYTFANSGFRIPVEVKLAGDSVETKIDDSGIQEGQLSLLNLKLYPLLGAEPYNGQDGYLLLPDGSGSLVRFKDNRSGDKSIYRESVYGQDIAFYVEDTERNPAIMPVFGIKSGSRSVLGIMTGGEAYAKLFAAPGGVYGSSYWATPEWQYRVKFFQSTSRDGKQGFFTYNKTRFASSAGRTTRYYFLEGESSGYAGMADVYRKYLTDVKGVRPAAVVQGEVPMFVDIIGADTKPGLLRDDYLAATTTIEAGQIVQALHDEGIGKLSVQYEGWQQGGFSSYGGLLPVDDRLGGNKGMKTFIDSAHALGADVYLSADYSRNNSGRDGFWPRSDGLRNLAGTVQQYRPSLEQDEVTYASPKFAAEALRRDLPSYRALGADGIVFTGGFGTDLSSDYNAKYAVNREQALTLQTDVLRETREALGGAGVTSGSFYALGTSTRFLKLADDYSYDLFMDEAVPFAEMVLHGLAPYTFQWSNLRDEYRAEFLRSIEYGAAPSFVFTAASSNALKQAYSVWYYSTDYRDWLDTAKEEYRRYNEALGDVQDQAITDNRELAPGVKETVYAGGRRVIVNYNGSEYDAPGIRVPARDFIVVQGQKEGERG